MTNEQLIERLSKLPKDAKVDMCPVDFVACDIEDVYYNKERNEISLLDWVPNHE